MSPFARNRVIDVAEGDEIGEGALDFLMDADSTGCTIRAEPGVQEIGQKEPKDTKPDPAKERKRRKEATRGSWPY